MKGGFTQTRSSRPTCGRYSRISLGDSRSHYVIIKNSIFNIAWVCPLFICELGAVEGKGTWQGGDRTSLKAHDGDGREKCHPIILTPMTIFTMIAGCHGQQPRQPQPLGTFLQKLMWSNNKNNFPVTLRLEDYSDRIKIWRAVSTINYWFIEWFIDLKKSLIWHILCAKHHSKNFVTINPFHP